MTCAEQECLVGGCQSEHLYASKAQVKTADLRVRTISTFIADRSASQQRTRCCILDQEFKDNQRPDKT